MGRRRIRQSNEGAGLLVEFLYVSNRRPLVGFVMTGVCLLVAAGLAIAKPQMLRGAHSIIAFVLTLMGGMYFVYAVIGTVRNLVNLPNGRVQRPAMHPRYGSSPRGLFGKPPTAAVPVPGIPQPPRQSAQPAVAAPELLARERTVPLPYRRRSRLLSPGEKAFWHPLYQAVKGKYRIFCKVQLSEIVTTPPHRKDDRRWFRKIRGYHVDFVICDPATTQPLLAIELDDRSHRRPRTMQRDLFKNEVLAAAGMPIYRVRCEQAYDPIELRQNIDQMIAKTDR